MKDSDGNDLVAGALYCCAFVDWDYDGQESIGYGSLVRYGSDGNLYCTGPEDKGSINPYYGILVKQSSDIDNRFIF